MKLRPLGNKIVVRRDEAEGQSKGGILIPDSAKDKPKRGKVLAVGQGKMLDSGSLEPMYLKEGDKILFGAWAGSDIELDGTPYLILTQDDVLAVIE